MGKVAAKQWLSICCTLLPAWVLNLWSALFLWQRLGSIKEVKSLNLTLELRLSSWGWQGNIKQSHSSFYCPVDVAPEGFSHISPPTPRGQRRGWWDPRPQFCENCTRFWVSEMEFIPLQDCSSLVLQMSLLQVFLNGMLSLQVSQI